MNLRTRLTLGFSLTALLGVGLTGGLLIYYSYHQAMQNIRATQLLIAENRAYAISQDVVNQVNGLRHLSTLSDLDLTDENLEPEKAMLRHARHDPLFFSVETSAISPKGEVLWTEPQSPGIGHDVSGLGWFEEARRTRESFVTEDTSPGTPTKARLVVPLWRDPDTFAGCLTSVLDPTATSRWGEHLKVDLGQSGTASLVDRRGRVVESLGAREVDDFPTRRQAVAQALAGKEASIWGVDAHGRDWLVTAVPLRQAGWALVLRQARGELDDHLSPELRAFVLMLLLGISLALALGVVYSRTLARPVIALAKVAREVEQGRFDGVGIPSRQDELGDLERAFFSMAATLDAKVRDRTRALEEAQAQLMEQGRFAAMGKTAAAIAHELKNALNGLGVAIELLTQGNVPRGAQGPIREQARQEIARLRDITDNLNIFAGTPRLTVAPHDLAGLVQRACTLLTDRIQAADVALKFEIPADLPPVPCDGQKLQGVIINLIKNAVEAVEPQLSEEPNSQAAPPKAGRPREVRIAGRRVDGHVELEVADSGPGIAVDVACRLFEPFFTTKRTGTGLGLAIGRKVVEAHGGSLVWAPNSPSGTRMLVRLPLEGVVRGSAAPRELQEEMAR